MKCRICARGFEDRDSSFLDKLKEATILSNCLWGLGRTGLARKCPFNFNKLLHEYALCISKHPYVGEQTWRRAVVNVLHGIAACKMNGDQIDDAIGFLQGIISNLAMKRLSK